MELFQLLFIIYNMFWISLRLYHLSDFIEADVQLIVAFLELEDFLLELGDFLLEIHDLHFLAFLDIGNLLLEVGRIIFVFGGNYYIYKFIFIKYTIYI